MKSEAFSIRNRLFWTISDPQPVYKMICILDTNQLAKVHIRDCQLSLSKHVGSEKLFILEIFAWLIQNLELTMLSRP